MASASLPQPTLFDDAAPAPEAPVLEQAVRVSAPVPETFVSRQRPTNRDATVRSRRLLPDGLWRAFGRLRAAGVTDTALVRLALQAAVLHNAVPSLVTAEDKPAAYQAALDELARPGALLDASALAERVGPEHDAAWRHAVNAMPNLLLPSWDPSLPGELWEHFAHRGFAGSRSATDQYFTPAELCETIARCLDIPAGATVLDPACGTAGLLGRVLVCDINGRISAVHGIELISDTADVARANLQLRAASTHPAADITVATGNALQQEWPDADIIVANPPFSTQRTLDAVPVPAPSALQAMMFLQRTAQALRPGGQAAVVVPQSLCEGAVRAVRSWEAVLDMCRIDAVLLAPKGMFPYASVVSTAVVFLRKAEGNGSIPVFDGREASESIPQMLEEFEDWFRFRPEVPSPKEFTLTESALRESNFNFTAKPEPKPAPKSPERPAYEYVPEPGDVLTKDGDDYVSAQWIIDGKRMKPRLAEAYPTLRLHEDNTYWPYVVIARSGLFELHFNGCNTSHIFIRRFSGPAEEVRIMFWEDDCRDMKFPTREQAQAFLDDWVTESGAAAEKSVLRVGEAERIRREIAREQPAALRQTREHLLRKLAEIDLDLAERV